MKSKLILFGSIIGLVPLFWFGWHIANTLTPEDVEIFFKRCPYDHYSMKKITNRVWAVPWSWATRDSVENLYFASCFPGNNYGKYYCSKCRFVFDIEEADEVWTRHSKDLNSFQVMLSDLITTFPAYSLVVDTVLPFGEQMWFCTVINDSVISEGTYYLSSESPSALSDSLFNFYNRTGKNISRISTGIDSYQITEMRPDESLTIDVWRQHYSIARICLSRRLGRVCG